MDGMGILIILTIVFLGLGDELLSKPKDSNQAKLGLPVMIIGCIFTIATLVAFPMYLISFLASM